MTIINILICHEIKVETPNCLQNVFLRYFFVHFGMKFDVQLGWDFHRFVYKCLNNVD